MKPAANLYGSGEFRAETKMSAGRVLLIRVKTLAVKISFQLTINTKLLQPLDLARREA